MNLKNASAKTFISILTLTILAFTASNITAASYIPPLEIEKIIRNSFEDASVMISIAKCESKFRQYNPDGSPLYGGTANNMVGVFQINTVVHTAFAESLGYDITTLDGNIGYARYLYQQNKTDPWISSFPCWNKTDNPAPSMPEPDPNAILITPLSLTKNLSLGMIDNEVKLLQQLLNRSGFLLASQGPGSPGNETAKFGALTRQAVKNFQCARSIVCSGDEYSTGYGFVDSKTRQTLQSSTRAPMNPIVSIAPDAPLPDAASIASLLNQITSLQAQVSALQKQLDNLLTQLTYN